MQKKREATHLALFRLWPAAMRLELLLLAAALRGALGQTVAAWDCTTYPYPVQIIKGSSDTNYRTMQLNLAAGDFTEMWAVFLSCG